VVEFDPPKPSREIIDRAHEHAPYEWTTSLPGMKRGGEMAFTFNFIPGEADFDDLLAEMDDQEIRNRRIVFPNGSILPFAAFLIRLEPAIEIGGAIRCLAAFQISGQVGPIE
jgi:hypothetical protein